MGEGQKLNANSTYVQKSFSLSNRIGQTMSLQTSFVVDDTALTTQ